MPIPTEFEYSRWRHGGWYVHNVRYPSGAIGCVSRNYEDRKWRIACDPRPFNERPTFASRDEAARAEYLLINSRVMDAAPDLLQAVKDAARMIEDTIDTHIYDDDEPPDAPERLFVKRLRDLIAKVEG